VVCLKKVRDVLQYKKFVVAWLIICCLLSIGGTVCFADTPAAATTVNYHDVIFQFINGYFGQDAATAEHMTDAVINSATHWGVDPLLVAAEFGAESGYNMGAASDYACGVAQLTPATAASLGVTDIWDIDQNIEGGVNYLAQQLKTFKGNPMLAAAAYNAGPDAVINAGNAVPPYKETQNYIQNIDNYYQALASGQPLSASQSHLTVAAQIILHLDMDFAKNLRDIIEKFALVCKAGIQFVINDVKWLFFALVTIDLAFSATMNLMDEDGEPVLPWLLKRFIKYGFFLYLLIHWGDFMSNAVKDYFVYMGAVAGSVPTDAAWQLLSDPTNIVQKGAYLISPAFFYIGKIYGIQLMLPGQFISAVTALLLALGIFICFVIIGLDIMCAYLEFYIIASLSVVTVGFSGLSFTRNLAGRGIVAVIILGFQLMFFTIFAALLTEVIKNYVQVDYEFTNYLRMLLASLTFVCTEQRIRKTIKKMCEKMMINASSQII
jgi:P-type conjugative transfer protein TrbL